MRIDTQNKHDDRDIAIQEVGVSNVFLPLKVKLNGNIEDVSAKLTLAGSLKPSQKGIHMSRFLRKFNEYEGEVLTLEKLYTIAEELKEWEEADDLYMTIDFDMYVRKKTPVTGIDTYSKYPVQIDMSISNAFSAVNVTVGVLITSLCPASKENSKYGAHNQRGLIETTVLVNDFDSFDIEPIIDASNVNGSCEIYEILKLEDEKHVTEKAYENPKFVEDLARDMYLAIDALGYERFEVKITNYESIHEHDAYCVVRK